LMKPTTALAGSAAISWPTALHKSTQKHVLLVLPPRCNLELCHTLPSHSAVISHSCTADLAFTKKTATCAELACNN
jgi:hypothetical protein